MKNKEASGSYSKIIKCAVFLLIFSILLGVTSFVTVPKINTEKGGIKNSQARGFFGEPEFTIEVLGIGNSDLYSAVSPMQLWNKYGITSYMCGEASQTVYEAYYLLLEFLEYQRPSVLIFETDELYQYTGNNLPDKGDNLLRKSFSAEFPVFEYHNRWKTLKLSDFTNQPNYTWRSMTKGFYYSDKVVPYDGGKYMEKTNEIDPIPDVSAFYLERILEVCDQYGISVVLMEIPCPKSWNFKKHNAVSRFADEHNIPFVDLNLSVRQIGLNWQTDLRDAGYHLNYSGAKKCTEYIGDYLHEHFYIEDKRNFPDYSSWNEGYSDYIKSVS